MGTKKIIFLDIDGVMNSEVDYLLAEARDDYETAREEAHELSERCVGLLNNLIDDTGAEVVITSVWRYSTTKEEMQSLFEKKGFKHKILDYSPVYDRNFTVRGNEILGWIKKNEEYLGVKYYNDFETYVIFDDDSDMLYWQRENFIPIDGYTGLTHNKTYKAKWILNRFDKKENKTEKLNKSTGKIEVGFG
jgi:cell division septum initiation protein DivIVA